MRDSKLAATATFDAARYCSIRRQSRKPQGMANFSVFKAGATSFQYLRTFSLVLPSDGSMSEPNGIGF
jgi:hypothetical protein